MRPSIRRRTAFAVSFFLFIASGALAAPAKLSTLTLASATIPGSNQVTGTLTLTANAPNGGAAVALTSTNPSVASVPTTVTIAKGLRTANFTVTTVTVSATTSVTIGGSYNGGAASAPLDVTPPMIQTVTVNPAAITAVMGTSTGTVTLDADAPAGGLALQLGSSDWQQYRAAEPAVASVTVPAGQRIVSFPIVSRNQAWGNPYTSVTITATNMPGYAWGAGMQVYPCSQPTASAVTPPANEYIWIDDDLPFGMITNQQYPASWDTTQHASGTRSIHQAVNWSMPQPPSQLFYLEYATDKMPVSAGESVVVYVLVHQCAPPVYMILEWRDVTTGYHHHATFGMDFGNGYVYLGPVPTNGQWTRVEIPVAALGMPDGGIIDSFYSSSTYGMHWIDRIGKTCTETTPSPITIPGTDTVWIDDALPAGTTLSGSWDTAHAASGTRSLATGGTGGSGLHTVSVSGATSTLPINTGDKLVAHVLVNSCMPAKEVMIHYHTTDNQTKTVVLGGAYGIEPPGAYQAGGLATGQWQRVVVPASTLGLEGLAIDGIQIDGFDGFAYVDALGKTQ